MRRDVIVGLVLATLLGATSCSGTVADGGASGEICTGYPAPVVPDEVTIELRSDLDFVAGDTSTTSSSGHSHRGALVADGDPHLHYCVTLVNGYEDPVTIQAIQVLPGQSEEPLAVVEADALAESLVGPDEGVVIDGWESVDVELLIPASDAVSELHHRIAYTVAAPDGPIDRFSDQVVVARD